MKYFIILLCFFVSSVLAKPSLPILPDNMSVIVMQANDGKILFNHHAKQAMTPASTTKILTAYTALKTLGPQFTYNTQVFQQGNDLWVRFVGDPSLTQNDLSQLLVQAIHSRGITRIDGDIIIDHTAFAGPWLARGWTIDDTPWHYAAPVHGVILDENRLVLTITPPKQINQPVKVTARNPRLTVESHVTAVDSPTAETLCQITINMPRAHHILLEGCWPQANPPQNLKIANHYPVETAQAVILDVLKSKGVAFQGSVKTGKLPTTASLLAEHRSAPLSELIKPVLQKSNNLYTESMTKTLGGKTYGRPTFQAGSYYIQKTLQQQLPLSDQELALSDGSGLSSLNLISANALAQTLRQAYQNENIKPYFLSALSSSGSTGTLKYRLTNLSTPFVGKTGGMTHISALAGYHGLNSQNPLIYVIMVNNAPQKGRKLKQFEDKLLSTLINSYFTNNTSGDTLSSN